VVHEEAHPCLSDLVKVTLEGVNSARVNGFLIQTIPPIYNSFTEEKSSNVHLTTSLYQLCTMSACVRDRADVEETTEWCR